MTHRYDIRCMKSFKCSARYIFESTESISISFCSNDGRSSSKCRTSLATESYVIGWSNWTNYIICTTENTHANGACYNLRTVLPPHAPVAVVIAWQPIRKLLTNKCPESTRTRPYDWPIGKYISIYLFALCSQTTIFTCWRHTRNDLSFSHNATFRTNRFIGQIPKRHKRMSRINELFGTYSAFALVVLIIMCWQFAWRRFGCYQTIICVIRLLRTSTHKSNSRTNAAHHAYNK